MAKSTPRTERTVRVPHRSLAAFTVLAQRNAQLLTLSPIPSEPNVMQANLLATDQELYQIGIDMGRAESSNQTYK